MTTMDSHDDDEWLRSFVDDGDIKWPSRYVGMKWHSVLDKVDVITTARPFEYDYTRIRICFEI